MKYLWKISIVKERIQSDGLALTRSRGENTFRFIVDNPLSLFERKGTHTHIYMCVCVCVCVCVCIIYIYIYIHIIFLKNKKSKQFFCGIPSKKLRERVPSCWCVIMLINQNNVTYCGHEQRSQGSSVVL